MEKKKNTFSQDRIPALVPVLLGALLSAVLLATGFAPFDFWFAGWIGLVPLLWAVWKSTTRKRAALAGFVYGLVFWLLTIYWFIFVIEGYSDIGFPLSWLLVLATALYLSLYPLGVCYATRFAVQKYGAAGLFLFPFLWVFGEYLQTFVITGFPWNLLGYTQIWMLPAIQIADITGVYGISFMLAAVNAGVAFALISKPARNWGYILPILAVFVLVLLVFLYGSVRLADLQGRQENAHTATLIQDDLTNEQRLRANYNQLYLYYHDETRKAAVHGSELVVWAEGALLFTDMVGEDNGPPTGFYEQLILSLARDENIWLLMGSNDYFNNRANLNNTALTISPENDGRVTGRYAKVHLTPFGEYVPFQFLFFWLEKIVPEISDFLAGDELNTMPLMNSRVGVPICYEIIFPGLVRQFCDNGAQLLVTISNDAWFGRSPANDQHFNIAVMRAVENRRYLLRCAATGVSGIVEPTGIVRARTGTYERKAVTGTFAFRDEVSFYTAYGDLFALLCSAASVAALVWLVYTDRRGKRRDKK